MTQPLDIVTHYTLKEKAKTHLATLIFNQFSPFPDMSTVPTVSSRCWSDDPC